jgi:hypothetical protein
MESRVKRRLRIKKGEALLRYLSSNCEPVIDPILMLELPMVEMNSSTSD